MKNPGLSKGRAESLLRAGNFAELFRELGWDSPSAAKREFDLPLPKRKDPAKLRYVMEKRGFVVCLCDLGDKPVDEGFRRAVRKGLARLHYENLLIFRGGGRQFWEVSIRPQNRPLRVVPVCWWEKQDARRLLGPLDGIFFGVDEEDGITIVDIVDRVRESFTQNAEKVTRQFYARFKEELDAFAQFIRGLVGAGDGGDFRKWHAALTLNRLMFCYFIQKKGFLDGDADYLRNRLKESREKFGADKFHRAFYRKFLRRLFHEGLGSPPDERRPDFAKMLGKIPYLNGGLFDPVDAERQSPGLDIADAAFERVFDFFDKWNWILDDRPNASGRDISPDVIGYIFEKHINDRAQMGAYYTREDVTGHIARGAILPVILRRARDECKAAFSGDGNIWKLLRKNPEGYIRRPVRHGCEIPDDKIPDDIRIGLDPKAPDLARRRKAWNRPAPPEFAHPAETWREVVARRARFRKLRESLQNGECDSVEFLLSRNLDIQKFVDDAVGEYEGSDFVLAVFRALAGREPEKSNQHFRRPLSVLDPACGSGAFLFAALNVLVSVYEKCLGRMEEFEKEDDFRVARKKGAQKKFPEFRRVLAEVRRHPTPEYWIRKSCILNNLHGADIMPEAVEIAKLRLFLNLAGQAERDPDAPNLGLEPLPDMDFNIRRGNSLVGFADLDDFEAHAKKEMYLQDKIAGVRESARCVDLASRRFRQAQARDNSAEYREAKADLAARLGGLNGSLNGYLARVCGKKSEAEVRAWTESHRPFHWLSEFYGVMSDGGFDAVIGNPPYVRAARVGYSDALPKEFKCPDIYGHMVNAAFRLGHPRGNVGFVVMNNMATVSEYQNLREVVREKSRAAWFSYYGRIPSGLFSADVRVRNCVFIAEQGGGEKQFFTARLHRWNTNQRENLFPLLAYAPFDPSGGLFPCYNDAREAALFQGVDAPDLRAIRGSSKKCALYFRGLAYNWVAASPSPPPSYRDADRKKPVPATNMDSLAFRDEFARDVAMLLFNGKLFFAHWLILGSDFGLTKDHLLSFKLPIGKLTDTDRAALRRIARQFEKALPDTLQFKLNAGIHVGSYNTAKLWGVTDKSDMIFLRHMTDNPDAAFDAVETHIAQTIKTERKGGQ